MRQFLFFLCSISSLLVYSQGTFQVLHYTETSGFDHQTRNASLTFFQSIPGITITDDQTGASFSNLNNLLTYDLIVFSNTSGDAILDSSQRSHFEAYMQQGGALLGIHAASDTYRHSTANGTNTGSWDFYAEALGGSVQQNPNHVAGTPNYEISRLSNHPIIQNFPPTWDKNEEYYYWENGYLDTANIGLLEVETTVGPNGLVNSYDSSRLVAWYKTNAFSGKVFYTSLGHLGTNFSSDSLFQRLIIQAVNWCLGRPNSLEENKKSELISIYPNPANDFIEVQNKKDKNSETRIYNTQGQLLKSSSAKRINISDLKTGLYLLNIENSNYRIIKME